jgi:hypothetical protein
MVDRIEACVESGAAALFAAAVGFCVYRLLDLTVGQPALGVVAVALGAGAYLLCRHALTRFADEQRQFAVPTFDIGEVEQTQPDELLLTDADRLQPIEPVAPDDDPLVLDDVLAQIASNSRVVRLFDPAAMPTPGQLQARIDRHLEGGIPSAASPDASQALYDALAELRLSLN